MYTLRSSIRRIVPMLGMLLMLVMLPACERAVSVPRIGTFVGFVENSDAFVGLVRLDDQVVAYVCDGRTTATWLRGQAIRNSISLESDGTTLDGTFDGAGVIGTFTSAEGGVHRFKASPAVDGAGFYRASETIAGSAYVAGWIILRNGQQRGAVKRDGEIMPERDVTLDPTEPSIALPGGGMLTARPAERMLAGS
jgi:hypothetical protein